MQPTIITLNIENSLQYILKYIEVSNSKGAFLLSEANILKRCFDVILYKFKDKEISLEKAKELVFQGLEKGQLHGDYTLDDASIIVGVMNFINSNPDLLAKLLPLTPIKSSASPVQKQFELYSFTYSIRDKENKSKFFM